MAGRIRKKIEPVKERIQKYLTETQTTLDEASTVEDFVSYLTLVENNFAKLKTANGQLEKLTDQLDKITASEDDDDELVLLSEILHKAEESLLLLQTERDRLMKKVDRNDRREDITRTEQLAIEMRKLQHENVVTEEKHSKKISVKLPKLSFPKFGGEILKWQAFWDSFSSAVDQNENLNPVDKFNYLRAQLYGEARQAVEGLELTNTNYKTAVEILTERFGKRSLVEKTLYAKLTSLQESSNEINCLRYKIDEIEKILRSWESLGASVGDKIGRAHV